MEDPSRATFGVLIVLVVIIVVMTIRVLMGRHSHEELIFVNDYSTSHVEDDRHGRLYSLLGRIGDALRRRGIPYWSIGGTILGAVRHGGIIPWDDDIDIALWATDLARARKAILDDLGDSAVWGREFRSYTVTEAAHRDITVDIFPATVLDDGTVHFINPHARKKWSEEFLTPTEYGPAPLAHVPFGPITVPLAANPCSYLDRVYPQWDTTGQIVRHHQLPDGDRQKDDRTIVHFDRDSSRLRCEPREQLVKHSDDPEAYLLTALGQYPSA